uniref:Uncharacterized protein n=1 Tax=Anopheles coluzzii TaxID=1518534 RepID=A0A8W7P2L4_ANOCL
MVVVAVGVGITLPPPAGSSALACGRLAAAAADRIDTCVIGFPKLPYPLLPTVRADSRSGSESNPSAVPSPSLWSPSSEPSSSEPPAAAARCNSAVAGEYSHTSSSHFSISAAVALKSCCRMRIFSYTNEGVPSRIQAGSIMRFSSLIEAAPPNPSFASCRAPSFAVEEEDVDAAPAWPILISRSIKPGSGRAGLAGWEELKPRRAAGGGGRRGRRRYQAGHWLDPGFAHLDPLLGERGPVDLIVRHVLVVGERERVAARHERARQLAPVRHQRSVQMARIDRSPGRVPVAVHQAGGRSGRNRGTDCVCVCCCVCCCYRRRRQVGMLSALPHSFR